MYRLIGGISTYIWYRIWARSVVKRTRLSFLPLWGAWFLEPGFLLVNSVIKKGRETRFCKIIRSRGQSCTLEVPCLPIFLESALRSSCCHLLVRMFLPQPCFQSQLSSWWSPWWNSFLNHATDLLLQSREYILILPSSLIRSSTFSPAFKAGDPSKTILTLAKGVR